MLKKIYNEELTKKSWDDYFSQNNQAIPVSLPIINKLEYALKLLNKGNNILDAGCGSGIYSDYLHQKGFKVVGIDYSPEAINVANARISNDGAVEFVCAELNKKLPFDDDTFDSVVCINSLHCIDDDSRNVALDEMIRVLKDNGILFLTVFSVQDEYMPRKIMEEITPNTYKDKWSERIFHFFTKKELMNVLKDFDVIDHELIVKEREVRNLKKKEYLHSVIARKK